jgi:hypothetical protein
MIDNNKDIAKESTNGTLWRVIGITRKSDQPVKWKNYDGKKVYSIMNVNNVE